MQREMIEITRSREDRRTWVLSTEIEIPCDIHSTFAFFAEAENLESITPPSLKFQIVTPLPIEMHAGRLIDYRLRLYGVPIGWQTEISVWEPPYRFVDRQLRGPYRKWVHTHTFEDRGDATRVRDRVEFRAPGGDLLNRLLVQRELRSIFAFRQTQIASRISGATAADTQDAAGISTASVLSVLI